MLKKAGIIVLALGFIELFIQFVFPDFIPDIIRRQLEQDNSNIQGYNEILQLSLIMWYFLGIATSIIGIIMIYFGLKKD